MPIILGVFLVLVTLSVLLFPLLRRSSYIDPVTTESGHSGAKRFRIYQSIVELKNDFQSGEIPENEYHSQLTELKIEAAKLMHAQAESIVTEIDDLILEQDIRAARKSIQSPSERAITPTGSKGSGSVT